MLKFVLLITIAEQLAIDIFLPSMPQMSHFFSTSSEMIQYTVTLFTLGFAFASILAGPISESYGRKKMTYLSLFAYILCSTWAAYSVEILPLLFSRFAHGVSCGFLAVASQAILQDCYHGQELAKAQSYNSLAWSVVPSLAPVLGGIVDERFGWQYNFLIPAAYALLLAIICRLGGLKETLQTPKALSFSNGLQDFKHVLKTPSFIGGTLGCTLTFGVTLSINLGGPFILQNNYQLSPSEYGYAAFTIAIFYMIGTFANSKLVSYFSCSKLIRVGMLLISVACAGFVALGALNLSLWGFIVPSCFLYGFIGLIYPNCATLAFSELKDKIGTASSLYITLQLIGCTIISWITALIPDTTQLPLSYLIVGITLALWGTFKATGLFHQQTTPFS